MSLKSDSRLFWGCFIALITCAFGFVVRTQIIGDWAVQFNLSETQKGDILGVGFWPFAFSIIGFSFVIDKIGYGWTAFFGFLCHVISTIMLFTAKSYEMLYWGTFIFAISNGTVEAYINPAVATLKKNEKTKWLNILHAGWPGGIVLAGLLAMSLGDIDWKYKVALTIIPTIIYGILLLGQKFPVSERVAAGITYREMLKDFGAGGAFIAGYLVSIQALQLLGMGGDNVFVTALIPAAVVALLFGLYTRSLGHWLFFVLSIIMIPLATTELGIDSWITELMKPEMGKLAPLLLIYTALIMTVLRFFAGGIVSRISPLGLLAVSALLAAVGLVTLSSATGALILIAATIYGVGKTFFWPTMLGVVSEQCPRGGALTLNTLGGVGMLGLSVGGVFLGNIQDTRVQSEVMANEDKALASTYLGEEKNSLFGKYKPVNRQALDDKVALYSSRLSAANKLLGDKKLEADAFGKITSLAELTKDSDVTAEKIDAALAEDPAYTLLVRNVSAHNAPQAPQGKDGADPTETELAAHNAAVEAHSKLDYDGRLAQLQEKGLLLSDEDYASALKDKNALDSALTNARKNALFTAAALPIFMLLCYLGLIAYFKSKGGYKPVELEDGSSTDSGH